MGLRGGSHGPRHRAEALEEDGPPPVREEADERPAERPEIREDVARTDPPPALASKRAGLGEHQDETPWQSVVARMVEVAWEVSASAARAEGPGSADARCSDSVPP
jgi:hypothetical protein